MRQFQPLQLILIFNKMKIIILFLLFLNTYFIFSQNYSIKNRWTINSSYSLYAIHETRQPFIISDKDYYTKENVQKIRSNVRININYAFLNSLEAGLYVGFMQYPVKSVPYIDTVSIVIENTEKLAPTFGININFHILPLFLKSNVKSKWDLYISAKYGGCYFICYRKNNMLKNGYLIPISDLDYYKDELYTYRHEYGVGVGGSVFFWNLVGFNTELSVGQFSYWPRMFSSNFNFRAGIIFKLNANRNKIYI